MRLQQGVAAEILIALALVMATGTILLTAVLLEIDDDRVRALHGLLARGFAASAHHDIVDFDQADAGRWWTLDARGSARGLNASASELDEATRALALESVATRGPIVESSAPWEPIRFATPSSNGGGAIAGRIDAPIRPGVLLAVLVCDGVVFVLFGWILMRRRVADPLRRLVSAVREISVRDGGSHVRAEGVAEIAELARAFNEMQVALASRTGALEKAVRELRSVNASLVQAREGLDRAERLAMVGSLAAGVAHEVGNPMGALLTYLDLVGRDAGLGEAGKRSLTKAVEQGERVRLILRQLLDFSRPPRVDRGPLDLADVAARVIDLVSTQHASSGIAFERVVADDAVAARGDLSISLQIVLNLALNAVAAVREGQRRVIRFEVKPCVRRRRRGDAELVHGTPARVDAMVCRVIDSGPGVAAEHAERIFDPFFTTKAPGEGTGLGLANARRLAEEMGGAVELETEPTALGGAAFRFVLPLAEAAEPSDGVRLLERGDGAGPQSRMS